MTIIIDYGAGNLRSIQRAIMTSGGNAEISGDPDRIASAERLVLPGVGNARAAMDQLRSTGIAEAINQRVRTGTPLLGVCLGMQLMFGDQEEGPTTGLELLDGDVVKLPADHKIPHMGWNVVTFTGNSPVSAQEPAPFYFVHSYIVRPQDDRIIAGETDYGMRFPSIVIHDNIWGAQFHPEKSQNAGLSLIQSWLRI